MAYQSEFLSERIQGLISSCLQPSLSHIACELKVERHTLERVLRKTTGRTFRQLRAESLARRAAETLTNESNRSIKEVAFLLGYNSSHAFTRFIKQNFGFTPSTIRHIGGVPPHPFQEKRALLERMK